MTENTFAVNCGVAFQSLLHEHFHRVRSITIPFSSFHICQELYTLFPNLISFNYIPISPDDKRLSTNSRPGDVNLDAPKLQTLVLHDDTVVFDKDAWPSLRSLEYLCCSGNEEWLWGTLGASQSTLQTLVLGNPGTDLVMSQVYSFYQPARVVTCTTLSSLTSLQIMGGDDPDWTALRFVDMPALTSLTIELQPSHEESLLPTFESLRSLRLVTSTAIDIQVALEYLLPSMPNITSLTVTDRSGTHDSREAHLIGPLLDEAQEPSGGPLLCRSLEEINLLGISTPTAKLKKLVELRQPLLRKIGVDGGLWAEDSWFRDENRVQDQALLEWLDERVELSGLRGWWEELPELLAFARRFNEELNI
ncbi:hypothetical protein M407DRAFT_9147 [Tulasnella calospora MUT 4182]|uniref:Uncharacterized protein n=1 Tax=Tulasnella calospora MUT 4182 TaxID=1051891 RepID=A0A0C3QE24_9AGAM|nr:hypothetical protein M407DRAFT_9147 [Tulasnella calospora MUT 4182]